MLPRLLDGCTGCRACADVCPDFVFEVYRFDTSSNRSSRSRTRQAVDGDARPARRATTRWRPPRSTPAAASSPATRCCRSPACSTRSPASSRAPTACGSRPTPRSRAPTWRSARPRPARARRPAPPGRASRSMQETIAEAALNELPLVVFTIGPRPAGLLPVHARRRVGRLPHHHARARRRRRGRRAHQRSRSSSPTSWLTPVIVYGDHLDRLHPDDGRGRPAARAGAGARQAVGARRQHAAAPAAPR